LPPERKYRLLWPAVMSATALIALAGGLFARDYCRATQLLLQLENDNHSRIGQLGALPITERELSLPGPDGAIRCRIYTPQNLKSPPVLLLVHGIHRLGMDEPRLVRFARAFAQRGVLVVTPEIRDLMEYRIAPQSIAEIGAIAQAWSSRSGKKIGLMGISFAGSLALMAAADPRYAPAISSVICLGAYDDLTRVTRFFVTERVQVPNGSEHPQPAEQYGALVLAYDHPEDLFPAQDVESAREALRLWLAEQYDAARAQQKKLSPTGKTVMEALFRDQLAPIKGQLLSEIQQHSGEMMAVSVAGKLNSLQARVFLLHGTDDGVIPSSETLWLEREVPARDLTRALVTPAVGHVDPQAQIKLSDQLQLVSFMAAAFRELEREPRLP
jgi:pimeloyl-ACP methyl ester carboxylesterase